MHRESGSEHNFNRENDFKSETESPVKAEENKDSNEALREEILKLRRENENLQKQLLEVQIKAEHDPLTGLLNRAGFETVVKDLNAKNIDSVLLALDIDKFKSINDEFGHKTGDEALIAAAEFLKKFTRDTDFVVRLGGEELVVLFPETTVDQVATLLERLNEQIKIEVPFDFNSQTRPDNKITFSGGVVELKAGQPVDEVVDRADKALYEAKENGRNQILFAAEAEPLLEE